MAAAFKPSKPLARLIEAAEQYGDAAIAQSSAIYSWKRGDPPPPAFDANLTHALHSAARAYATSTRRLRKT